MPAAIILVYENENKNIDSVLFNYRQLQVQLEWDI
jgi:hypothetical protein